MLIIFDIVVILRNLQRIFFNTVFKLKPYNFIRQKEVRDMDRDESKTNHLKTG